MTANNKPRIAIIGAGWLGKPLALRLLAQHYPLTVSCCGADKRGSLHESGIPAVQATLTGNSQDDSQGKSQSDWQGLLSDKDIAICLLPPNRGNHAETAFVQQIKQLLNLLEQYQVAKLIFISSTGIYHKTNQLISETAPLNPHSSVYLAEQVIAANQAITSTVLRFSGLISHDRNPTTTLSKKSLNDHIFIAGLSPINLIHRNDCIGIIEQIIVQACWGEVFNACCDCHPTRQQFYQLNAQQLAIAEPQFSPDDSQPACIIDNAKLTQRLNYHFQHNTTADLAV
ncbi:MAG: nucleoside-diphosphate-sugar epimerase [Moritella sp.]|jgi:nucleoside-diphosphate-sugar epimerase